MPFPLVPWLIELWLCISVIVLIRFLFGKYFGPRFCRMLWILIAVRALIPFSLPIPNHPFGLVYGTVRTESTVETKVLSIPRGLTFVERKSMPPEPQSDSPEFHVRRIGVPVVDYGMATRNVLAIVWIFGVAAVLGTAWFQNRRIVLRSTRLPVVVPDWVQEIFLEERKKLRIGAWPVLIVSPCVASPCLVGAIRPRILIPESMLDETIDREAIRFMLLHELVHLKSGDIWLSWLWTFVFALHWFDPAFWGLGWFVSADCETACDDRVLDILHPEDYKRYGKSLLDMMVLLNPPPIVGPGLSAVVETRFNLERRLNLMARRVPRKFRRTVVGMIVLLGLAAFALTGYAEPPRTISLEKAQLMGLVEDHFMNNYRDIAMRKSLEWGEPKTETNGNRTIRYKFEALIWDKDRKIFCSDFSFDKQGEFIDAKNVDGFPKEIEKPDASTKEGLRKLVEKFFSQNYRDITNRITVQWGEPITEADGSRSIKYKYKACIWNKDWLLFEEKFTFAPDGELVEAIKISRKPLPEETGSAKKTSENSIDAKKSQALAGEGWRNFMRGNHADAVKKFEESVAFDPKNANAYQGLGWALWNLGKGKDAKQAFETCLSLDPKNGAALNGLGQIAQQEGNEDKAIEYWTRGIEADSRASGPAFGLGNLYADREDYDKAIKYYRMALKIESGNPEIQNRLKNVEKAKAEKEKK